MPAARRDTPGVDLSGVGVQRLVARTRPDQYWAYRSGGAARRLRGRVAVLHLRVGTLDASFSRTSAVKVDQAALLARSFYVAQAARFGVDDLDVDVIPGTLRSTARLPELRPSASGRLDETTRRGSSVKPAAPSKLRVSIPLERLIKTCERRATTRSESSSIFRRAPIRGRSRSGRL
jgi:hypothetical protein